MNSIEFISHEFFYDDQYTKEICYLSIDSKFRFAYVRKMKKDGGLFWAPISLGVSIKGEKKYRSAIEWDSNFMAKDILSFLESRTWESKDKTTTFQSAPDSLHYSKSSSLPQYSQGSFPGIEECPF